jgi:hypothetical protein
MATAKPSRSTTPRARATAKPAAKPAAKRSAKPAAKRSAAAKKPKTSTLAVVKPVTTSNTKGQTEALAMRDLMRKEAMTRNAQALDKKERERQQQLAKQVERSYRFGQLQAATKLARDIGYRDGIARFQSEARR